VVAGRAIFVRVYSERWQRIYLLAVIGPDQIFFEFVQPFSKAQAYKNNKSKKKHTKDEERQ